MDEFKESIEIPTFDAKVNRKEADANTITLSPEVEKEVRDYVTAIALMYHENPFHK